GVIAGGGFKAGDRPGNTAGGSTDPEDLRRAPVERDVDGLHLPGRAGETLTGNGDEEVVQSNSARRRFADEQEAASAGTGERALRDPGHAGSGNARVDRVPAFAQHLGARLGGERVPGRHRAPHPASVTTASGGEARRGVGAQSPKAPPSSLSCAEVHARNTP